MTLTGVEKLPQEKISVNFGSKLVVICLPEKGVCMFLFSLCRSFDLQVLELDGKNYQLHVVKLSGSVVPSESRFTVSS